MTTTKTRKSAPRLDFKTASIRMGSYERLASILTRYRGIGFVDAIDMALDAWEKLTPAQQDALALRRPPEPN